MKRQISLAVAAFALVGCTTKFTRPGATEADFQADKNACSYEATKHAAGFDNSYRSAIASGFDLAMRRDEILLACMKAKGWTW